MKDVSFQRCYRCIAQRHACGLCGKYCNWGQHIVKFCPEQLSRWWRHQNLMGISMWKLWFIISIMVGIWECSIKSSTIEISPSWYRYFFFFFSLRNLKWALNKSIQCIILSSRGKKCHRFVLLPHLWSTSCNPKHQSFMDLLGVISEQHES